MKNPNDILKVLRICNPDMYSRNGFKWPKSGHVKCPDWKPTKDCGNGLHGYLINELDKSDFGVSNTNSWDKDRKFLVVEVKRKDLVNLGDKVKFKEGYVVACYSSFDDFCKFHCVSYFNNSKCSYGNIVKGTYFAVGNDFAKSDRFASCVDGIAYGSNRNSYVKGNLGSILIICNNFYKKITARVDGVRIKENVWYKLNDKQNKLIKA